VDFKKLYFAGNRLAIKIFPFLFLPLMALFTIIILMEGLPFWETVKFLAFAWLVFGMIYGVYRFLRYIFSE